MFFSDVTKLNVNSAGEFSFSFELAGKNKLWAVMHFIMLVDGSCLVLLLASNGIHKGVIGQIEASLHAIVTRKILTNNSMNLLGK